MNDQILSDPPQIQQPPAPDPVAEASRVSQENAATYRMDRLENAMAELTNVVRDVGQKLVMPQAPPPKDASEFLNDLASDPQGVIRREVAAQAGQMISQQMNPTMLQVLDTQKDYLLRHHQQTIDQRFGEGTFEEIYKPTLSSELSQLRSVNPHAMASPEVMDALVNKIGGQKYDDLRQREAAVEKYARQRGLSHLLPGGGIPRLRGGGADPEVPEDVEQFLRGVEKQTGETIDRKRYAKNYHSGREVGPGRHRTDLIEWLKTNGADAETLKNHGGEST